MRSCPLGNNQMRNAHTFPRMLGSIDILRRCRHPIGQLRRRLPVWPTLPLKRGPGGRLIAGEDSGDQTIDAMPEPAALPALKASRKRRKSETLDVVPDGADPGST
jgi:hypothetical protein